MKTNFAPTDELAAASAPNYKKPVGGKRLATAADIPLYVLSLTVLALSAFSAPRVSAHRPLIFAGFATAYFCLSLAQGRTREHATRRGVGLFTVLLINVYFITFTRGDHSSVFLSATPMGMASILSILVLFVWTCRLAWLRSLSTETPVLDFAVLAFALINLMGFVRVSALHDYYGVELEPQLHLTWVVVVSTLLYYVFKDLGRSELPAARMLPGAPLLLILSCTMAAAWPWL